MEGGAEGEATETDFLRSMEPDSGLDPMTRRSQLEQKSRTRLLFNQLSLPRTPRTSHLEPKNGETLSPHAYWLKEAECRNQGHDSKPKETGSFNSCIRSPPAPGPPKGHSFCWTKLLQSEQSDRIGPILGGQLLSGTPTRREVSPLGPIIQVSGPRNSISSTSTGGGEQWLRVWVRQSESPSWNLVSTTS